MERVGTTRSVVERNHAFLAADSHVAAELPGWRNATGVILISPRMGARFCQYLVDLTGSGCSAAPARGVERFCYVVEGAVSVAVDEGSVTDLSAGGYAFLPPDMPHEIRAAEAARLLIFEKSYVSAVDAPAPMVAVGHVQAVAAEPFLGDPAAMLKSLLPVDSAFDMAINVFTYEPGATLPFVEVHVMEHGLYVLEGAGVYRLGSSWYPTYAGDSIWMGAYCEQWFVAMGKTPASYIYYKDVHRDPLGQ